jgi:hypothetical protein
MLSNSLRELRHAFFSSRYIATASAPRKIFAGVSLARFSIQNPKEYASLEVYTANDSEQKSVNLILDIIPLRNGVPLIGI